MAPDAALRVAFLGPAGTYTEEALVSSMPGTADRIPCDDVQGAVEAVRSGKADAAVVPIENSIEGSVTATLDVLAQSGGEVRIVAEVVRPIRHCLIAREGAEIGGILRVLSHPQALAQCAGSLRDLVPGASSEPVGSTAEAVRVVAAQDTLEVGAIASALAAERYGCAVLAEGLEDEPDNLTRFVWVAAAEAGQELLPAPPEAAMKTSIVFWGFNDESPGALVAVLSELADREINLTKIESRPSRRRPWEYVFFLDLQGHRADPRVARALERLAEGRTARVLGSYRKADDV